MLIEIILILIGAVMFVSLGALIVLFSYRQGLKDGRRVDNNQDLDPIKQPKPEPPEPDPVSDAIMNALANRMNYDPYAEIEKDNK